MQQQPRAPEQRVQRHHPPRERVHRRPPQQVRADRREVDLHAALGAHGLGHRERVVHARQEAEGLIRPTVIWSQDANRGPEIHDRHDSIRRELAAADEAARPLVVGAVVQDVAAQPRIRRAVDHLPDVALGLVADDARHQAGGWWSPNGEPWSSLQNLKRPNLRVDSSVSLAAHVRKDLTPELDDARDRRVHVVDGEEQIRPAAGVVRVHPALEVRASAASSRCPTARSRTPSRTDPRKTRALQAESPTPSSKKLTAPCTVLMVANLRPRFGRDLGRMGGVKISTFEHWRFGRRVGTLPRHGDASVDRDRPVQDDRQVPRARGGDAGLRGTAAVSPADAERPGAARGLRDLVAGRGADPRLLPVAARPGAGRRRARPADDDQRRRRVRAPAVGQAARAPAPAHPHPLGDRGPRALPPRPLRLDRARAGGRRRARHPGPRRRSRRSPTSAPRAARASCSRAPASSTRWASSGSPAAPTRSRRSRACAPPSRSSQQVVVKLDAGVSGEGNAIVELAGLPAARLALREAPHRPALRRDADGGARRADGGLPRAPLARRRRRGAHRRPRAAQPERPARAHARRRRADRLDP